MSASEPKTHKKNYVENDVAGVSLCRVAGPFNVHFFTCCMYICKVPHDRADVSSVLPGLIVVFGSMFINLRFAFGYVLYCVMN